MRVFILLISILIPLVQFGYGADTNLEENYVKNFQVSESSKIKKDSIFRPFLILTKSSIIYEFGSSCYFSGSPPLGRSAIDYLLFQKNYQKIKAVLDGNNKEGKIYAIEALLNLSKEGKISLTTKDKENIQQIIELNFQIRRCQGCGISMIKTLNLFKERTYKKLLKKNSIKIKNR